MKIAAVRKATHTTSGNASPASKEANTGLAACSKEASAGRSSPAVQVVKAEPTEPESPSDSQSQEHLGMVAPDVRSPATAGECGGGGGYSGLLGLQVAFWQISVPDTVLLAAPEGMLGLHP